MRDCVKRIAEDRNQLLHGNVREITPVNDEGQLPWQSLLANYTDYHVGPFLDLPALRAAGFDGWLPDLPPRSAPDPKPRPDTDPANRGPAHAAERPARGGRRRPKPAAADT